MKRYFAAAGLFVLAASAAAQSGTGADQSVVVPAQKQMQMQLERKPISPQEFYTYQGSYALSNGQTLTLTRGAVHLYAQVGRQQRQEILWHGDGKFSTADGSLDMRIVWIDDDTATGELNYLPRMSGLEPVHATLSIASR
ncbi:hypothetical protein [Pseudoduganella violaceinigra]|uniref:hypothetical protein n=1 Tax=Pseudoduganella violaceinigra TaxID=246602 RepID=UPI00041A1503|nr:hypothetical protein [Pseudoduganella violaceinigra]